MHEKIRPRLTLDGGNIELLNINEEDGRVVVKLIGAGCPMASMKLLTAA
ncbi:MAG: NifU family protein [Candidatus Thermoplasmatota archaeon]